MQAQADKTYRQNDQNGFDQHPNKLVDRPGDRGRLILQVDQAQAGWQRAANAPGGGLQGFAKCNDVTALGHGNPECNNLPSLMAHLHLGRINVGTTYFSNIAEPQLLA